MKVYINDIIVIIIVIAWCPKNRIFKEKKRVIFKLVFKVCVVKFFVQLQIGWRKSHIEMVISRAYERWTRVFDLPLVGSSVQTGRTIDLRTHTHKVHSGRSSTHTHTHTYFPFLGWKLILKCLFLLWKSNVVVNTRLWWAISIFTHTITVVVLANLLYCTICQGK